MTWIKRKGYMSQIIYLVKFKSIIIKINNFRVNKKNVILTLCQLTNLINMDVWILISIIMINLVRVITIISKLINKVNM
jgi:hypothetical protein